MTEEFWSPLRGKRLEAVRDFLQAQGLRWDERSASTLLFLEEDGHIAACGSLDENILKCIAVSQERQGEGLAARLVSGLTAQAVQNGYTHLFLFTRPEKGELFSDLGFYEVAHTPDILWMENRRGGIRRFTDSLRADPPPGGVTGCIVAHADPFTRGHQYLCEVASASCDRLYLFILTEDRGMFPAADRLRLARENTAHLANVRVCGSGPYLISYASFPDYFLKEAQVLPSRYDLDLTAFAEKIAPPLGITRRFVGSEPFSAVTAGYNRAMERLLPERGIEVVELPRREAGGQSISAGRVRDLIRRGQVSEDLPFLPVPTRRYVEETVCRTK